MFNLPDRVVVKEAQRQLCLSASFWAKIRAGNIPYTYNKTTGELKEATYNETIAYTNKGVGEIYWVKDEDLPKVEKALKETYALFEAAKANQEKLKKYK
jgi:hypothetical protein